MENDDRQEKLHQNANRVTLASERLHQMRMCLLMQSEEKMVGAHTDNNNQKYIHQYQEGLGGGLKDALQSNTHEIQTLRFQLACKVFDMHRLDIGEQFTSDTTQQQPQHEKTASGVGKISGLPLPHAGPVLYGVIPPEVLSSSLRLVASLTQLVSCCLGVVLPHPILVYPMECKVCGSMYDGFGGDIIDASMNDGCDDEDIDGDDHDQNGQLFNLCSTCRSDVFTNDTTMMQSPHHQVKSMPLVSSLSSLSSSSATSATQTRSKSSLLSFVGSSARRAISLTSTVTSRAMSHIQPSTSIASDPPSNRPHHHHNPHSAVVGTMQKSTPRFQFHQGGSTENSLAITTRRINYASYAYLRENHDTSATEYVLHPPRWGGGETSSSSSKSSGGDTVQSPVGRDGVIVKNGTTMTTPIMAQQQPSTYATREEFHAAEERFATGLQLLQNDIVALCFRAGVDVPTLWPAESVLLNLHALWCHCRTMDKETGKQ